MPGEFTVTSKKPGEKIEFDCPVPVPPEMKIDANGKPVEAEKIQAIYAEMNEGRADVLTLDPNGELFGPVILAAGFSPAKPKVTLMPILDSVMRT